MFAIGSVETGTALASITDFGICTRGSVPARILFTSGRRIFAIHSAKTERAKALVIRPVPNASTAVRASIPRTIVNRDFALGPVETGRTTAGVTSLAGIKTSPFVLARLVIGAKI